MPYLQLLNCLSARAQPTRTTQPLRLAATHHTQEHAGVYRNIKQYPNATTSRHICVVRADAPLYFANADHITTRIRKYAYRMHGDDKLGPTRFVVLDMAPMSYIDATGALLRMRLSVIT